MAQFVASFGAADVELQGRGTLGDLELDPGFRFETATKLRLRRDGRSSRPRLRRSTIFFDCIATGTPPEADGEEGLADMRALIAIERALLTGQPQPIASPSALPSSNSRPCAIDTSDGPPNSRSLRPLVRSNGGACAAPASAAAYG